MTQHLDPGFLQYGAAGLAVLMTIIFGAFSLKALSMLQKQAEATEARYRALVDAVDARQEKREQVLITTVQDFTRATTELTIAVKQNGHV